VVLVFPLTSLSDQISENFKTRIQQATGKASHDPSQVALPAIDHATAFVNIIFIDKIAARPPSSAFTLCPFSLFFIGRALKPSLPSFTFTLGPELNFLFDQSVAIGLNFGCSRLFIHHNLRKPELAQSKILTLGEAYVHVPRKPRLPVVRDHAHVSLYAQQPSDASPEVPATQLTQRRSAAKR
jgi:hypothetical protein